MSSCLWHRAIRMRNERIRDSVTTLHTKAVTIFVEYYARNNYLKNIYINSDIFHGFVFFQTEGPCSYNEGVWEWKFNSTNSYLDTRWGLHGPILVS